MFEDGTGQMKVHCDKTHKYLGISLDFGHDNQCRITMIDYVDELVAAYDKALGKLDDGLPLKTKYKYWQNKLFLQIHHFVLNNHFIGTIW